MRCHICNATLSPPEISRNKDHNDWDPCSRCLDEINDVFNDKTEDEIDKELFFELGTDDDNDELTEQDH
jgi:hypothetical protein